MHLRQAALLCRIMTWSGLFLAAALSVASPEKEAVLPSAAVAPAAMPAKQAPAFRADRPSLKSGGTSARAERHVRTSFPRPQVVRSVPGGSSLRIVPDLGSVSVCPDAPGRNRQGGDPVCRAGQGLPGSVCSSVSVNPAATLRSLQGCDLPAPGHDVSRCRRPVLNRTSDRSVQAGEGSCTVQAAVPGRFYVLYLNHASRCGLNRSPFSVFHDASFHVSTEGRGVVSSDHASPACHQAFRMAAARPGAGKPGHPLPSLECLKHGHYTDARTDSRMASREAVQKATWSFQKSSLKACLEAAQDVFHGASVETSVQVSVLSPVPSVSPLPLLSCGVHGGSTEQGRGKRV